jgi:DNA-binding Lrp family transcriptional regulator
MHPLDQKLLEILRKDARLPLASLARRLAVPRSTVQYRLDRLERSGIISGYTIITRQPQNAQLQAHVMISIEPKRQQIVERRLRSVSEVRQLLAVSGNYDLIAIVSAASPQRLDEALDAVRTVAGIRKTVTAIVLSDRINRE